LKQKDFGITALMISPLFSDKSPNEKKGWVCQGSL